MSAASYAVAVFTAAVVLYGLIHRCDVYASFTKGAAEAVPVIKKVLPYTVAMVFAVRMAEASGFFDIVCGVISPVTSFFGIPAALIPLMLMRPFSGGGSMGLLSGLLVKVGPDSFGGRAASVYMGSSETLFYTVSVYFGSAGISKTLYVIPTALLTDVVGMAASCILCSIFL